MRKCMFGLVMAISSLCFGQISLNMDLLSESNPNMHSYNDVWGYVDEYGNEYAITASYNDSVIYFVDVTDCSNPQIVFSQAVPNSLWRDFKVYGDYAYVVADGTNDGLRIYNLAALPDGPIWLESHINTDFERAHNIYIDEENHRLYCIDTGHPTFGNRDLIMYDLLNNPANPSLLYAGDLGGGIIHDANVKNNIIFSSHFGGHEFNVWDATDPNNITLIESKNGFDGAHASWNDATEEFAYLAQEKANIPMKVIDLANLYDPSNDMQVVNSFWDPLESGTGLIAHNLYVNNDFLYVSHYEDGVKVYDISDRVNPQIAGYFDLHNNQNGYEGFNGTWGIYPFLPSGCILASGDEGLSMLQLSSDISDTCTPVRWLTGPTPLSLYSASNYVYSDGQIPAWDVVTYQAEIAVELQPGFETGEKACFEAKIDQCVPSN